MKYLIILFGAVAVLAIGAAVIVSNRAPATSGVNTASTLGAGDPGATMPPPGAPAPAAVDPAFAAAQQRALTELREADGWRTTASGLRYRKVGGNGNGRHPTLQDQISFRYSGRLVDGTVFDQSSEPVVFPLGQLIPGWQEGIQLMSPGERFEFAMPANLGYGDGAGPIPAGATLFFQVELVAINPAGGSAPAGR